jgi:cytochrome P450
MVREINLRDRAIAADPYGLYAELRAEAPIARNELGLWVLSRYEDVVRVLRDPQTFSSNVGDSSITQKRAIIIFVDPPDHTRMRGLVAGAFTPRIVEQQRDAIQAYSEQLVGSMCAKESADIVAELAYPLPVMVIARMLGVEDGDLATFKRWSDVFFDNILPLLIGGDETPIQDAIVEFDAYFSERLANLRVEREDTLLSALVHIETEDAKLAEDDLLMFCKVLLVAGNETTTGLIVNGVRAFADFPEAMERVRKDSALLPSAIEEALRFYPPFRGALRRATCDVEMYGETIRAGDRLSVLIESANRDETVFERPNEFLVDRQPNRHLAFGMGIHYCVGAPLARLEGGIALAALLSRIRRFEPIGPVWSDPLLPGGPKELHVRYELDRVSAPAA